MTEGLQAMMGAEGMSYREYNPMSYNAPGQLLTVVKFPAWPGSENQGVKAPRDAEEERAWRGRFARRAADA